MRVPPATETRKHERRGLRSRCGRTRRSTHFQDACRHATHHREVGDILNDDRIGSYDDIVTDTYPSKDLGSRSHLHTITHGRCAKGIIHPGVTEGDTMTEHTIVAYNAGPVDHYAAVMLDGEATPDPGSTAYTDPAKDLHELVEYDVNNRPGRAHDLVADHEARVAEAIHQQRPEAEAEQPLALCLEIFQNPHHGSTTHRYPDVLHVIIST